jgi:long-chain fatty acid transport protein
MIRRILSIIVGGIIIVAFISSSFASNGTQIGTVGAKSTAMGSAFRGLADDWSAVYYNPAGITQFGKWQIGASGGFIMPRGSYQAYHYNNLPSTAMVTSKVDAVARNFIVPSLGVFYKLTEKISVGLGVYAPFGLGTEWDLIRVPAGYGNAKAISKENENYSDHQVINIQPSVAYKISEKLSVGLGVSYIWGKMTLDQVKLVPNPVLASWSQISGLPVLLGLSATPWPWNQDQNRLIVESNLDGSGTAYGANVGILFKPFEKLSIGLSLRYCTDLKLKGDMKQTIAYPGDAAKSAVINMVPDALFPGGAAAKAQLLGALSGTNSVTEYSDVSANLPLPWTAGGGIAFKPSSLWTITVDASLTNWSAWDVIVIDKGSAGEDEMPQNWKNTIEIGAGCEYLAMQSECKKLFLRFGGYTVDSPVPNESMNPTLLDPSRRYVFTAGIGLTMGKVSVDLAFEHVLFDKKDIPASEYKYNSKLGYAENYAGIYKFNANVITLATTISL